MYSQTTTVHNLQRPGIRREASEAVLVLCGGTACTVQTTRAVFGARAAVMHVVLRSSSGEQRDSRCHLSSLYTECLFLLSFFDSIHWSFSIFLAFGTYLIVLIPKYFILGGANVNGIVLLISNLACSLRYRM